MNRKKKEKKIESNRELIDFCFFLNTYKFNRSRRRKRRLWAACEDEKEEKKGKFCPIYIQTFRIEGLLCFSALLEWNLIEDLSLYLFSPAMRILNRPNSLNFN